MLTVSVPSQKSVPGHLRESAICEHKDKNLCYKIRRCQTFTLNPLTSEAVTVVQMTSYDSKLLFVHSKLSVMNI